MNHGTFSSYVHGCRCRACTDANADHTRRRRTGVGFEFYEDHATRDEVKQWARGLGLPINGTLLGRNALLVVARYNREHPDRPYVPASERAS